VRLGVIMPVYNAMPFLPDAVDSLTSQTYQRFRLFIVDDASTDGSTDYLKTIGDDRVSVIRLTTRSGQGAARNLALTQCNAEYTAFMDADDLSLPGRFARQVQFLDENPDIGLVGTKISYVGESGRTGFAPPLALTHDEIRADLLRQRHAIVNATVMYRTDILQRSGGFRIDGAGEDWDLFLRMTELSRAANLDDILYLYRAHRNRTTVKQARKVRLRYAHACECARTRCAGGVETSFDDFCARQLMRPFWQQWAEKLEAYSSYCYREGLQRALNEGHVTGYLRIGLAATLSPRRLAQRVQRSMRSAR
jgi:glycosyltransferase involved in cell wall biosynthesis